MIRTGYVPVDIINIIYSIFYYYTPHWIPGTLLLSRGCGVVFVVVVVVVFLF